MAKAAVAKAAGEALREPAPSKRQAILGAAAEVFLREGYGAASMDAIARVAGVSKATVYAHFANKEALFAAIIEGGARSRFSDLDTDVAAGDIATALRGIAQRFFDMVLTPGGLAIYRVVVAESVRFPELGRAFYENGPQVTRSSIERFLRRAVKRGLLKIDNPRLAGDQFVGMIKGDLYLRLLLGIVNETSQAEIDEAVEHAVAAFLAAYAPR
ncbi:MAG TPA: TetR/AcrR family transcriptional regulator [Candidatus Cybelea sp.]|nr:TetR/AcrR family transcriptional regulator [Candidatus Cybelea sp.]